MIIAQKKKKHKFSSVVGSKRKVLEIIKLMLWNFILFIYSGLADGKL